MKKNFKLYIVIWALLLVVYNVIVFSAQAIPGYSIDYDARFWISWGFIIAAFVGQLACAIVAFSSKNNSKLFLNIPIISQSYGALIAMVIVGSVCMLIPNFSYWIATIICVLVFAFSAIGVIKAKAAGDIVSNVDEKVKSATFFVKSLTVDAETLVNLSKSEGVKAECTKVYEEIRYSDPMSNPALAAVESQITLKFAELSAAVETNNLSEAKTAATTIIVLLKDRNNKCKLLK